MKVAALDLGSNTFLCLIAEVEKVTASAFRITKMDVDEIQIVRLGQDVSKTKRLHPDALLRAEKALKHFKLLIEQHNPEKILAMATSAARDSENNHQLFTIGEMLGIPIEIIQGQQEARITYEGSISGQHENKTRLVVDIGGGSTEYIVGDLTEIKQSQSLNIGCVRLTENFITTQPTSEAETKAAEDFIKHSLQQLKQNFLYPIDEILAVAGTPTSLVAAQIGHFDAEQINGFKLTMTDLLKWKSRLQVASIDEKVQMGLPKGRADVMLIGVLILIQTLITFEQDHLIVSTRGVRHGIALEMARRYWS